MKTHPNLKGYDVLDMLRQETAEDLARWEADRVKHLEELKRLDAIISATRAYLRKLNSQAGDGPDDGRLAGSFSIRQMTERVLSEANRPMRVTEILEAIRLQFGRAVERTSISPILSKMAQNGKLHRDDDVGWSLT